QHAGMLELRLQRHRVGELASFDAALDRLEDAAVDRVSEVLGQQEFRDAFVGLVVGEQRAEQRLFGLQVGRRQTLREAEQRRGERVHRSQASPPPESVRGRGLWITADGRASTSLRAPLVAVVVIARWSARGVRFPAGAGGVTMRKQEADGSNVVRFPVERRESAGIELVSRLAPPRSLVDTPWPPRQACQCTTLWPAWRRSLLTRRDHSRPDTAATAPFYGCGRSWTRS